MNYKNIYDSLIKKAKNRKIKGYTETHHIIPRCLGGSDDTSNLVELTAKEHYIAHLLLVKIYEDNKPVFYKLLKAYIMMSHCKNSLQDRTYKVNSRIYESLKIEHSKAMSLSQSGKDNSQYGTKWIHNPQLQISKKVNKNEELLEGWKLGRVIKWNKEAPKKKVKVCNKTKIRKTRQTKQKKVKVCKYCGQTVCKHPKICKKHQMINTLINYFGFNEKTKGSLLFYDEYFKIVTKIHDEYHIEKLSTIELAERYNVSHQRIASVFKSLGIKSRTLSEAVLNYCSKHTK